MSGLSLEPFRDLLTVVVTRLVASVLIFRLNAGLQCRDLVRAKLEEAYATAHEYCMALTRKL